jgi:hypothetical protein
VVAIDGIQAVAATARTWCSTTSASTKTLISIWFLVVGQPVQLAGRE